LLTKEDLMRTIAIAVITTSVTALAQPAPPDAAPAEETKPAEPAPPAAPPPPPTPVVGVAPPATKPAGSELSVTYDKGLTFAARDDRFRLRLSLRNQIRFETTRPTEDNSQFASHFLIPRMRLQADGHVFTKATRYKLEVAFGDAGNFSFLKDLYVDQQLAATPVILRAGMWKRPFNRQELVSDFASEMNERAITATFVGGGRDLGVALHDDYEKSPEGLEWAIGVFNSFNGGKDRPDIGGCSTTMAVTSCPPPTNFPADFAPAVVARVGWNHGPIQGYSEGDLDGGPLRYAVGASYKIDLGNFAKQKEASVGDNLSHGLEVDAMLKVNYASLEVGVYMMKLPASKASNKSADAELGAFGQLGYMVVPKRFQLVGRFAIAPDAKTDGRNQIEARAGVNWYWQGHAWKWATDAGMVKTTGEDPTTMAEDKPDLVVRSMLQLLI
jgi:hypothetical protein